MLLAAVAPSVVIPAVSLFVALSALRKPGTARIRETNRPRRVLQRFTLPTLPTITALLVTVMLLVLLGSPAAARGVSPSAGVGIALLRVFPEGESGDPALDPAYVSASSDPWLVDSWVITVSADTASFGIVTWNRHDQTASDVFLRVAVNDVSLLTQIDLTISQGDATHEGDLATLVAADFAVGTPTLDNGASWPPHGIFPTSFASFDIGSIGPYGSVVAGAEDRVITSVAVTGSFSQGLKVHFDADGWSILDNQRSPIANADPNDTNIRNPNSADTTVQIPSVTSVVVSASVAVLVYLYAGRRRKKMPGGDSS